MHLSSENIAKGSGSGRVRAAENAWAEFVPFLQFDAEIRFNNR
ncbi:hypothetical protein [Streptomyces sp. NBC_00233]|nr:hypothetical protein [Streptomyces sp. NBC_00233]MCX5233408.1 hypothetical protein [Streptomyces sp. NBC_00233]